MSQQERPMLSGSREQTQSKYPEAERNFSSREKSGRGVGLTLQQVRYPPQQLQNMLQEGQPVLQENRPSVMQDHRQSMMQDHRQFVVHSTQRMQENRVPTMLQRHQSVKSHVSTVPQSLAAEAQQKSRLSQKVGSGQHTLDRTEQRNQLRAPRQDMGHLKECDILNTDGVTEKLNSEFTKLTGHIDHLTLSLNRSEESCRDAEAMKVRMQNEIFELQKSNEQLTQQIQSELTLRDNVETKVANVHSVCEMLAEHCERVRNTTSGIGMLEATLRKHQESLQSQILKLEEEYQSLESSYKMEREHMIELVQMEREKRIHEIKEANSRIKNAELELINVSSRLRAEQDLRAQNLQLLQEREKKIQELDQASAQQANKLQAQICESGSSLMSANSEIATLKQELMNQLLAEKDHQNKITSLEKEKSEMQNRIVSIDVKSKKMESSIEMLVNEKNELFMQLKEREYNLLTSQNEREVVAKQLEEAQKRIQSLTNNNDTTLSRLLEAQKSIERLEQVNSDVVVKLVAANASLDDMSSDKMKMMEELQKSNTWVKDLTQEKELVMRDLSEAKCVVDTIEREKEEVLVGLQEARLLIETLETRESEMLVKLTAAQQLTDSLEGEKDEFLQKLQGLGDISKNFELERREVFDKLHAAQTSMNTLMLEKEGILNQLNNARSILSCVEAEKEQVVAKLNEAESTVNALNECNENLTLELEKAKNTIQALEREVDEASHKLVLGEEHFNQLCKEKECIQEELNETHKLVENLEKDKGEITEKLKTAAESLRVLEVEKTELVDQMQTVRLKVQCLEEGICRAGEELQAKEAAFGALQEQKLELLEEIKTANGVIENLRSEKQVLSDRLQEMDSANASEGKKDSKKIRSLKSRIHAVEKEKKKLTASLQSCQSDLSALRARIKALQTEAEEKMKDQEASTQSEVMKVREELNSVQSKLDSLTLEHQEVSKHCKLAEHTKESLNQQLEDLQKQFEESLTLVKNLQNEKNEEIMKAKDIQKGVESYKEAFVHQKNDLDTERSKHAKEVAELKVEITTLQKKEKTVIAEKVEMERNFKSEGKLLKNDRFRLAKATQHYREEVKRLRNELTRIGEISSASTSLMATDDMTAPKSCLRSPKEAPVQDTVPVRTPKKRVMFESLETGTDTDDSIVTRRHAGRKLSMPSSKKSCYKLPEEPKELRSSKGGSTKSSKKTLKEEAFKSIDFGSLF